MAGYKETPRQKMIGMMYLVLTALLALNVSKDILQAFVTVNDGLKQTNANFEAKNEMMYNDFRQQLTQQKEKVEPYYLRALQVKEKSDAMVERIRILMADVVAFTEFGVRPKKDGSHHNDADWKKAYDIDLSEVKKTDNFDKPIAILIPDQAKPETGEAYKLRKALEDYEEELIKLIGEDPANYDMGFNYEPGFNKHIKREMSWEFNTFYSTVLAADVVIFNKMIAEVRNAEAEAVAKLMNNIRKLDFTFDDIAAKVVPQSMMIPAGSNYEATLFVAAYDSRSPIRAIINGQERKSDSGGVINLSIPAAREGEYDVKGEIFVFNPVEGKDVSYPFETSYSVFRPTATVSATDMNVFYRGLKNNLSVSVPGVTNANVSVRVTNAKLSSVGGGKYIVDPGPSNKCVVSVSAKIGDRTMNMGSYDYRVFKVPDPTPMVAGKQGGESVSKDQLLNAGFVTATLKDFLMAGANFRVVSFTVSIKGASGIWESDACRGAVLCASAKQRLSRVSRGQRVLFEDIRAVGPEGSTRKLPTVVLRIN